MNIRGRRTFKVQIGEKTPPDTFSWSNNKKSALKSGPATILQIMPLKLEGRKFLTPVKTFFHEVFKEIKEGEREMEIQEIKMLRQEAEKKILDVLNDLEDKTSMVIEGIDLHCTQTMGDPMPRIRTVQIKLAL
jgi:hypothetical protein